MQSHPQTHSTQARLDLPALAYKNFSTRFRYCKTAVFVRLTESVALISSILHQISSQQSGTMGTIYPPWIFQFIIIFSY